MKDYDELDKYLNNYSPKKIYDEIVEKGDRLWRDKSDLRLIKLFTKSL